MGKIDGNTAYRDVLKQLIKLDIVHGLEWSFSNCFMNQKHDPISRVPDLVGLG